MLFWKTVFFSKLILDGLQFLLCKVHAYMAFIFVAKEILDLSRAVGILTFEHGYNAIMYNKFRNILFLSSFL